MATPKTNTQTINAGVLQESGIDTQMMSAGLNPIPVTSTQLQQQAEFIFSTNPDLGEKYINTLVNRIAFEVVKSKLAKNRLALFKKGGLEIGDTIEEVFIEMAKGYLFDVEKASEQVFKRTLPSVLSKFHRVNYLVTYPITIQRQTLKKKFLNFAVLDKFIADIINQMYSGANYDEYLVMSYMLGRSVLNDEIRIQNVGELTDDNLQDIVIAIKTAGDDFELPSRRFNRAGVMNFSNFEDNYIIQSNKFKNTVGVKVLAVAFEKSEAEIKEKTVNVNKYSDMDFSRLDELLKDVDGYTPFTTAELTKLDGMHAVLLNKDWFMVYDYDEEMDSIYNSAGRYWNYFLHIERMFSTSPFENALAFTNFTGTLITAGTVALADGVTAVDANNNYEIVVTTTPAGSDAYKLKLSGNTANSTMINATGMLVVGADEESTALKIELTDIADKVLATLNLTVN